jgi:hypothetical protein
MRNRSKHLVPFGLMLCFGGCAVLFADLSGSHIVPLDDESIRYSTRQADDPVERLNQKIARGEVKLVFDETHGYLRSVLQALNVPLESQLLVFSKTSFQSTRISPRSPRALYFNDSTVVGFVRNGDVLEFSSVDPKLGVVFYTLDQEKVDKPRFERRDTACLQCHDAPATLGVPGGFMRSVYPDSSGMPVFQAGDYTTDDRSPFEQRWGGWYVTGTHGHMTHMGNSVVADPSHPEDLGVAGLNVTDLKGKFDTGAYLTPNSDIVALMILEHQARMANLITRVGYETVIALQEQENMNKAYHQPLDEIDDSTRHRIDSAVNDMVKYMLFVDEVKLDAPVKGTSGFAEVFQRAGLRDRKGRSLRDLDFQTRMFRYPLSYIIYTEAFDNMPAAALERIYRRLFDILTGKETSPPYNRLSASDRRAILEIVAATKPNLPAYWKNTFGGAQP